MDTETNNDDSAEFDPDEDIIAYEQDTIDEDDLLDVRLEAERIDAVPLAARVEIERRNMMAHDNYESQFATHEMLDVGMMLMAAKKKHVQKQNMSRVARIDELSRSFMSGFDIDPEEATIVVEEVDEQPTVDEDGEE